MKYALLAAAALIATPALAQTTTTDTTTVQTGTSMTSGGYQPAMTSTAPVPPGAIVRYVPSPTVEQAYPAPAPLAHYPICKRGQTDHCMQRGG